MNRRDFLKTLSALGILSILPCCKKSCENEYAEKNVMTYRYWPQLKAKVSLLGYGFLRLPKKENGTAIDKEKAIALIDRAVKGGINYFDTAWFYHNGEAESFAGEVLSRYPRDSYFLATKLPVKSINNVDQAKEIFYKQLEKCKLDFFDFYLLHELNGERWNSALKNGIFDFVLSLKDKNLVKRLGFSFHGNNQDFKEIINHTKWDFVQIQANYIDWNAYSKEQYDISKSLNIPVVVMEPLRGGELANIGSNAEEVLKKIRNDLTPAQWAFKFFGSKDNILTILSGMSKMEHLDENILTFSPLIPLNKEEEDALNKVTVIYLETGKIPCTGCRYCMPCPVGVSIPDIFKIYNDYKTKMQDPYYAFKRNREVRKKYELIGKDSIANNCVNCGSCLKKCPQGIAIPNELKRIHKELMG